MSELFDEDEDKLIVAEAEDAVDLDEADDVVSDDGELPTAGARRRLENMMDEKRLREELEDFLDF